ncbi:aminotransferase class I/II-fold pyridoxal phosphate-dependent enzyme [Synechococcus sp. BA-124 BA4]|uniref:aminotransferase class I/II-fold pyridoxal phosphate-dependent enzyme n=1 Tax=Synechococcus sp. BA-124 BA4 TaxID=3110251 RepID=UPI002B1FA976|nr:aminotransferase class I/II-fold pyridoxal phosphate-dependent enzyme [Synechococcus sp. BA-124 BA4]MEA5400716.1 aminotransferase class I/II-fold pyridoxal phosphate-dependent enzyme [Synechococcus sp. BA-124 BA4]
MPWQQASLLSSQKLVQRLMQRNGLQESDLPFFSRSNYIQPLDQKQYSSYDYLNLKTHPSVIEAASVALKDYGLSTSASRLMAGELPHHAALESLLAQIYGKESALVFVSGHATNVSTIAALVEPGDLVVLDQYSHNSIQMGVRLSGARRMVFPHNDTECLQMLLDKYRSHYRRCLIVTEGHFSMDGDSPDLALLLRLRDQYQALLMVDEAHSLGVLGRQGLGCHEQHGVEPGQVDIWMGTLSKSLASTGGFIAASRAITQHLRLHASGFSFSVGLNAPCCAAAHTALKILLSEPERVATLQANGHYLADTARKAGLDVGRSLGMGIIPIMLNDLRHTFLTANHLLSKGWGVYPIAPPTVPSNRCRLRLFVRSDHSQESMHDLVKTLCNAIHQTKADAVG